MIYLVRRVKCDEARPSCVKCTSTGRTCDGYEEAAEQQAPIQTVIAGYGNSQEARSIQFFIERTLSQLTSFFPDEFWGISILQGHTETAIRLFKHGHHMMSQFRQATGLNGILHHVQTLFNRLALQVAILVGDVMPQLSLKCSSGSQLMVNTNYIFSSLLEAREALYAILALRLTEARENSVLVTAFSQWSQAFDKFIISRGALPFSPNEQRSLALIDLHRRYFNMVLPWESVHNHKDVLSLDNRTSDFEELVDCASRVLGLEATDTVSQAAPLFHLEIGVAQEGVWSSHLTGRVARRIMEAEEEKLEVRSCKDVPGPRRDREWEEAIGW
ncbi:C6 zinc finger domain-containing protein [Fusarium coicis]|nr:C6 zinc finger domain-containing protein [Fusarium coicis]